VSVRTNDPYETLGVDRDADAETVKRAFRERALRDHPDRNPNDPAAEERFKRASEAYATLRDPEARRRYDAYVAAGGDRYDPGRSGPVPRPDFGTVDWRTVFREADVPIDWSRAGAIPTTGNVVFNVLFHNVARVFRQAGLIRGEDRTLSLRLDLATARSGGTRRVSVSGPVACSACHGAGGPCPTCGGDGVLRGGLDVDVRIPKGVRPGQRLRLQGLGGPGRPPGDAYVVLDVALPLGVRREGGDLATDVFVTPAEAAQGVGAEVAGAKVHVPAGVRDGRTIRVAGGGLGGGALLVTVHVDIWRGGARSLTEAAGGWLAGPVATARDAWQRLFGKGGRP
jgi:molecular chaperone DnaJ